MFCKNCGNKIDENDSFCSKCGTSTSSDSHCERTANDSHTDSAQVKPTVTKLKGYDNVKDCTCLECGYSGPMGVVGYALPPLKRYGIPLILSVLFLIIDYFIDLIVSGIFGISFLGSILGHILNIGICAYFFYSFSKPKILYCPNCEEQVIIK